MKSDHLYLQLATDNLDRLVDFYDNTLQLPRREDAGPNAFVLSESATLGIVEHSQTHGPAKDPTRMTIDLRVDDIDTEHARLEAAGVRFIRSKGLEFWGGIYSTFHDPDGNILQLMQYRPELAKMEASEGVVV